MYFSLAIAQFYQSPYNKHNQTTGDDAMRYESAEFCGLNYLIRYPQHYRETDRHPVILFLHGAGGRGSDLEHLKTNPYFQITDKAEEF